MINSSTIATVLHNLSVTQINLTPSPQHASRGTEDEQEGRPERQLLPAHPGERALPHPRGIHPLFPCSKGLLEGSADENEGLWHQHPHYVGQFPMNVFYATSSFKLLNIIKLNNFFQVCTMESAPARERGFQLPHAAGFRVSRKSS